MRNILTILVFVMTLAYTVFSYGQNTSSTLKPVSQQDIAMLVGPMNAGNGFQVIVTPELITEINYIRQNAKEREAFCSAKKRMKTYETTIQLALHYRHMPYDLLVLPLVQSGYVLLGPQANHNMRAGIWQLTPMIAKQYGSIMSGSQDNRLNTELSTKAALAYLKDLHSKLHDWNLTILAYEFGVEKIEDLTQKVGSHNAWDLAKSREADKALMTYLARYSAYVVLMYDRALLSNC